MKFIALKELPQGQQPGDEFEANKDEGNVLILVGAAVRADSDEGREARRRYRRRDMQAEQST